MARRQRRAGRAAGAAFFNYYPQTRLGFIAYLAVHPAWRNAGLGSRLYRRVVEGVAEEAILVPQQGVSHDPKGQAVALVVDPSDKVEQRILKVDRAIGGAWLVTQGLRPGDRVVIE